MKLIIKNSLAVLLLLTSGNLCAADDAEMRGAGAPAGGSKLVHRRGAVPAGAGEDVAMTEAAATGSTPAQTAAVREALELFTSNNVEGVESDGNGNLRIYPVFSCHKSFYVVGMLLLAALVAYYVEMPSLPQLRSWSLPGVIGGAIILLVVILGTVITLDAGAEQSMVICKRSKRIKGLFLLSPDGLTYYSNVLSCTKPVSNFIAWHDITSARIEGKSDGEGGTTYSIKLNTGHNIIGFNYPLSAPISMDKLLGLINTCTKAAHSNPPRITEARCTAHAHEFVLSRICTHCGEVSAPETTSDELARRK